MFTESELIFGDADARVLVSVDGVQLLIVATCAAPREWHLRVENEHGIGSHWIDFFDSAEAAIQAAQKAIKEEGVKEFVSTEGFEYLEQLSKPSLN